MSNKRERRPKMPIIIYERLGITYIRQRPTQVHDPKTPQQLRQRDRFALATAIAKTLAPQLTPEWHHYARSRHMTGLNLLVSQLMRLAITEKEGSWVADLSKIDLSNPYR